MRSIRNVVVMAVAAAMAACSSGGGGGGSDGGSDGGTGGSGLAAADFQGTSFTGTWNNTTFGSTGASKASFTVDESAKTMTMKLDLDGNVFGGVNPAEETFQGTYTDDEMNLSGTSTVFGTLTLKVTKEGVLTGTATPTRGDVTFDGTVSTSSISLNYTLDDSGSEVKGTLSMTK
jgi:hypothetical protein